MCKTQICEQLLRLEQEGTVKMEAVLTREVEHGQIVRGHAKRSGPAPIGIKQGKFQSRNTTC